MSTRSHIDESSIPEASSAEHLRLILDMSDVGIWELNVETGAAWRNEQHDLIFGYDELLPEWTYQRFLDHVIEEDRAMVDALYGGAIDARQPWSFECRIRRADGEIRWINATGRPINLGSDDAVKLIGHVIDVSHTKLNEEHLRVLVDELNHRVRNTLTVVQAIAARSFQDYVGTAQGRADFIGRIDALAAAHALLSERNWTDVTLGQLIDKVLLPHQNLHSPAGGARIKISDGPTVLLTPKQAVSLTMALNELATIALKHGALSHPEGVVDLAWTTTSNTARQSTEGHDNAAGEKVELSWRETGGPKVERGDRSGFGMTLLQRLLPSDLTGEANVTFESAGLKCRIVFDAQPFSLLRAGSP